MNTHLLYQTHLKKPLPSHPESVHVNHVRQKTGRGIGKEKCGPLDSFNEARELGLSKTAMSDGCKRKKNSRQKQEEDYVRGGKSGKEVQRQRSDAR